jgi:hypothetical protein
MASIRVRIRVITVYCRSTALRYMVYGCGCLKTTASVTIASIRVRMSMAQPPGPRRRWAAGLARLRNHLTIYIMRKLTKLCSTPPIDVKIGSLDPRGLPLLGFKLEYEPEKIALRTTYFFPGSGSG